MLFFMVIAFGPGWAFAVGVVDLGPKLKVNVKADVSRGFDLSMNIDTYERKVPSQSATLTNHCRCFERYPVACLIAYLSAILTTRCDLSSGQAESLT